MYSNLKQKITCCRGFCKRNETFNEWKEILLVEASTLFTNEWFFWLVLYCVRRNVDFALMIQYFFLTIFFFCCVALPGRTEKKMSSVVMLIHRRISLFSASPLAGMSPNIRFAYFRWYSPAFLLPKVLPKHQVHDGDLF